jgi:AcrR family transcriptional regulator
MQAKPESRMERKKEETQSKIIATAMTMFKQYGLDSVTMEQIAEEADIAKGTLYNYFPSREAIINAFMLKAFLEKHEERLAQIRQLPDTRSRLIRILTLLVEGVQAQKEIFEVFMVYRMKQVVSFRPVEGVEKTLPNLIREIIELGKQSREIRTDLPVSMLEDLFDFIVIEAIKPFYLAPDRYDRQKSIEQCVDLYLHGVGA